MTYDQETLRFIIAPREVHLLQPHDIWYLTLDKLGKEYYLFENANISVNGTVEENGLGGYLLEGYGYTIGLRGSNNSAFESNLASAVGTDIRISGCLRFDETSLQYYIETRLVQ